MVLVMITINGDDNSDGDKKIRTMVKTIVNNN